MLYRALSLFLLLCPFYTAPADMVTYVAKGIKHIVIPAVSAALTGKQVSISSHYRRMRDFSDMDRGVPFGVQRSHEDNFNAENDAGVDPSPRSFNTPALYSEAGVPLYHNGTPTEEYFKEQTRIAQKQERQTKEAAEKQKEAAKIREERDRGVREQYLMTTAQKILDEKEKAFKEGKGLSPELEMRIRHSKQPEALKTEELAGGSGGGDKGPEEDEKEIIDKMKHRSGLERKAVQDPDIRQTYQELIFPDTNTPGGQDRNIHIFRPEEGHLAQRTPEAIKALKRAYREGTHLGQDIHGNHHIEWIHPDNGDQFWLKVRPDGKIMDGGASEVGSHWIRDPKTNFLQKPKGLGKKGLGKGNWKYKVVTVIAGSAIEAAANEAKDRLGLNDDELTAFLQDKIEKMMPEKVQQKMTAERKAAFDRSLEELRAYEEKKHEYYNEKKFPKLNIPVIMEKKIESDLAPTPRTERSESSSSSSGGSFSPSSTSSSPLRLSDSQISEIRASSGGSSFKLGSDLGSIKLGSFSGSAPMKLNTGSFGKSSSLKFAAKDDDDDDMDDLLWDDGDDDDDSSSCTGLGCQ